MQRQTDRCVNGHIIVRYDLETKTLMKRRAVGGGISEVQLLGEGPVMPAGAVWAEWLVEENRVPRWESVCVPRTKGQWSRSVLQDRESRRQ